MPVTGEPSVPFRWDVVTPAPLGTLLDDVVPPERQDLFFLDPLVACAGKVVARSGGGELVFVGRSLDSMYDLLGGALADYDAGPRLLRLPVSFAREHVYRRDEWVGLRPMHATEVAAARRLLASLRLSPRALARRTTPVTFVDVVHHGSTFGQLFDLLRTWTQDERAPWAVVRRKLRFVGVTVRTTTSPNAHRWQQHASWTRELPAGSVVNVSLDRSTWMWIANDQDKTHRPFTPPAWVRGPEPVGRDDETRWALSEAVAFAAAGRTARCRRALARATDGEPALAQPWLRRLVSRWSRAT